MIVEFKSVRSSLKEVWEREQTMDMGTKPSFEYKEDYMSSFFLEMDDVIDFAVGKVWFNGVPKECIYARLSEEETPNLVIDGRDFKKILEHTKNCKIKTADEILNNISNENNSTGI